MTLKKYHQKRNFSKTPEPVGKLGKKSKFTYMIQKHAASHLHYDFRLELDGVLKSWAVPKGPSLDPSVKRLAVHVEDHPIEYASFEGIIPKGQYGGGTVMLWDQGSWQPLDEDVARAYKKGDLKFRLNGEKLKGDWKLIQIKKDPKNWLLIKATDDYARPETKFDITKKEDLSVKSGRSMEEIAANKKVRVWNSNRADAAPVEKKLTNKKIKLPAKLATKKQAMPLEIFPELATLVDDAPNGKEWLHEIKYDGYRLLSFVSKDKIRMMTRGGLDWAKKFPTIVKGLKQLKLSNVILDGEIVAFDAKHHSNFQLLQNALQEGNTAELGYYVFDILYYQTARIDELPLIERKKILESLFTKSSNAIFYSDHIIGDGNKVFEKACKLGLEGIISKKIHSTYQQCRTRDWLKVKCVQRQEFVIGGFTQPSGNRDHFGALLVGFYNKKKELVYSGRVGTGFTADSLTAIAKQLKKHIVKINPFSSKPPGAKNITWVKPILVAEVEYSEMTNEGILRHPSFKGLRSDKPSKKIILEKPKPVEKITHAKNKTRKR